MSIKKHILVISQYFYPEEFRINDICKNWIERGYKVTVVTGIPNYPQGEYYEGYSRTLKRREKWEGIDIVRLPIRPRYKGSINLIRNYFSFVFEGYKWVRQTDIIADLVYTYEVSPMTQALVGIKYARKFKVPHYLYVTDLWPENIEIITGIKNKVLIYPISLMVDYIYKHSKRIFTSSKSFIKSINDRGVPLDKLEFWPQYAEEYYKPVSIIEPEIRDCFKQDTFNIVFAGNIGYAQGLNILIPVVQALNKRKIKATFVLIGDGRYKSELHKTVQEQGLSSSFQFIERQPSARIPAYLAMADALLISLAKSEVFSITIPAKTQSCLACAKPILLSADGEVQQIITESGAGFVSNAEDFEGLVSNIEKMMALPLEERLELGKLASDYSKKFFDREKLLDRIDEVFYAE